MVELRLNEIMDILSKKKQVSNKELCQKLHCSISTLRRDLLKLEERGVIRRTHGGATLITSTNTEFSHFIREDSNIKEKQIIADLAQDFIASGMCIFLDSSSTVQQLVPLIRSIPNLVVVTNGLKIALDLSEGQHESLKVFITGGEVKMNSSAVISQKDKSFFDSFQFDLSFFSCRGVDLNGVYEASFSQAQVKKEMMQKSKQAILLVDDSKFNSSYFIKIGRFSDYDTLVTNREADMDYLEIFEKNKLEIIYPYK
jgi:DeoR/GlpR family transcriptional regulator of sugar metabolism